MRNVARIVDELIADLHANLTSAERVIGLHQNLNENKIHAAASETDGGIDIPYCSVSGLWYLSLNRPETPPIRLVLERSGH